MWKTKVIPRLLILVTILTVGVLRSSVYSQSTAEILSLPILNPDSTKLFLAKFLADQIPLPPVPSSLAKWQEYATPRVDSLREFLTEIALRRKRPARIEHRGFIPADGFRIEKYIVEVVEGMEIPLNLYVPNSLRGRVPLILNPNGFYLEGKAHHEIQMRCAHFARAGFVSAAWDFVHSGERGGWENVGVPGNHSYYALRWRLAGIKSLPLTIVETQAILDQLLQLPFVDSSRVAIIGSSQGAMTSLLVSAIDQRIKSVVAAIPPAPFKTIPFSNDGMFLEENWFHWVGTFTPGIVPRVSDLREIMSLIAPRPVLLFSGLRDVVRVTDVEAEFRAARRVYELFGKESNIVHHAADMAHEFNQDSRERSYEWLQRVLYEDTVETISEYSYQPLSVDDLRCGINAAGETVLSAGARLTNTLPVVSYQPSSREDARNMQDQIRISFEKGTGSFSDSVVGASVLRSFELRNGQAANGYISFRSGFRLPLIVFTPKASETRSMVFLLSDSGKASVDPTMVNNLVNLGYAVCVPDLFNIGELQYRNLSSRIVSFFLELKGRTSLAVCISQMQLMLKSVQQQFGFQHGAIIATGPMSQLVSGAISSDPRVSAVAILNGLDGIQDENISAFPSNIPGPYQFMGALTSVQNAYISALVSPKPLVIQNMTDIQGNLVNDGGSHHASKVRPFYLAEARPHLFSMQTGSSQQVVSWIAKYLPNKRGLAVLYTAKALSESDATGNLQDIEGETNSQALTSNTQNLFMDIPATFEIKEAYPNPFNPSTTFTISIPEPSSIKAIVYEVTGRVADEVGIDYRESGNHTITWSAPARLASGTYFFRFEVRGESGARRTETRRVVLLR